MWFYHTYPIYHSFLNAIVHSSSLCGGLWKIAINKNIEYLQNLVLPLRYIQNLYKYIKKTYNIYKIWFLTLEMLSLGQDIEQRNLSSPSLPMIDLKFIVLNIVNICNNVKIVMIVNMRSPSIPWKCKMPKMVKICKSAKSAHQFWVCLIATKGIFFTFWWMFVRFPH